MALPMFNMPQRLPIPTVNLMPQQLPPAAMFGLPPAPPPAAGELLAAQQAQAAQESALAGTPDPRTVQPPAASPGSQIWQALSSDPSLQMMLLTMGLNLMQPRDPTQTSMGHAAQAIGQGVNAASAVKQREYERKVQERQLGQTDTRIGLDQQRVDLERERVDETKKTGDVQRKKIQQDIANNEKLMPKTIAKLDAEIDKMVADKGLTGQQEAFWRERARLYPEEIRADLKRAQASLKSAEASQLSAEASMRSAKKPTGAEALFVSTATAEANRVAKKGTPEWEKAFNEAKAKLGSEYFGKSSSTSATVQTTEQFKQAWMQANPKGDAETPEAYNRRVGEAVAGFMTSKKKGNYNEQLAKFLGENKIMMRGPEDEEEYIRIFDRAWNRPEGGANTSTRAGGSVQPASGEGGQPRRQSVTMEEIRRSAQARGVKPEVLLNALKKQYPDMKIEGK